MYHAREHLWGLATKLFPRDEKRRCGWARRLNGEARRGAHRTAGGGELSEASKLKTPSWRINCCWRRIDFQRNAERMRYDEFRRQGLFVGSGVIEAGMSHGDRESAEAFGDVLRRVRGANASCALCAARGSPAAVLTTHWDNRARAAVSVTNLSHTPSALRGGLSPVSIAEPLTRPVTLETEAFVIPIATKAQASANPKLRARPPDQGARGTAAEKHGPKQYEIRKRTQSSSQSGTRPEPRRSVRHIPHNSRSR